MKNNNNSNCPVKKNEVYEVTIVDLTHDGMGVGKVDTYPIFIENAIPGEEVEVLVLKATKKFAFGKVTNWIKTSPDRVTDVDDKWIRTGIAPLHHMTYEAQLRFKQHQVESAMQRIGGFDNISVAEVVGMEEPYAYRNKAQIPVRKVNRELETGFFRKNSHDLVPMENFYIQDPAIDDALVILKDIMKEYGVKPYDEEKHSGTLKNIMIRKGHYSNELMVVLVTRKAKIFKVEQMVEEMAEKVPNLVSIVQNIHPEKTNVLMSDQFVTLHGRDYIKDTLLGNTYCISASSFYQINTVQAEALYTKAIELAELKPTDTVVDVYCGIGTIGLSLAKQVKQLRGIEMVPQAIRDAKTNALMNDIENVEYQVGKAEYIFPEWVEKGIESDVIIVDPPRKGLDAQFIEASVEMNPDRIIYISCNPGTLARDLKIYAEAGYTTDTVYPFDMFPQTTHIECLTVLTKK